MLSKLIEARLIESRQIPHHGPIGYEWQYRVVGKDVLEQSSCMTRSVIWYAVSSRAQNEPDKISLPQQEADARALCVRNEWQIIDILRVPGHSRRYIDVHELASDAAKEGIDAFYRLLAHWDARDFYY